MALEATYHTGQDTDLIRMFDTYLFKNYNNSTFNLTMSQTGNTNNRDNYLGGEMFHTPSFGDDEFDVSAITIPYTNNTMSVSQSAPAMQPMPDIDFSLTQPLSHAMPATTNCSTLTNNERNFVVPKFPPQNFYVPDINVTNSITQPEGRPMMTNVAMATHSNNGVHHDRLQTPLTTICQAQISSQLGFQTGLKHGSPVVSNSTGSPRSSEDSDDCLPLAQLANLKRSAQMGGPTLRSDISVEIKSNKKQKTPKKKKKKDPNEPQKPVSAYALFFRDTQAAIKGQNTNASFGEVSKIVASMWDGLDPDHKSVYKQKTDLAKKEYLKQLAAYRASLVSQTAVEEAITMKERMSAQLNSAVNNNNPVGGGSVMMMDPMVPLEPQAPMMNFAAIQQQQQQPAPAMLSNIAPRPAMETHNMQGGMAPQPQTDQMYSHMGDYSVPMSLCSRNGCMNQAVESPAWDNEYCSNDCVMAHCRDVFTAWVASRQNNMAFTVK